MPDDVEDAAQARRQLRNDGSDSGGGDEASFVEDRSDQFEEGSGRINGDDGSTAASDTTGPTSGLDDIRGDIEDIGGGEETAVDRDDSGDDDGGYNYGNRDDGGNGGGPPTVDETARQAIREVGLDPDRVDIQRRAPDRGSDTTTGGSDDGLGGVRQGVEEIGDGQDTAVDRDPYADPNEPGGGLDSLRTQVAGISDSPTPTQIDYSGDVDQQRQDFEEARGAAEAEVGDAPQDGVEDDPTDPNREQAAALERDVIQSAEWADSPEDVTIVEQDGQLVAQASRTRQLEAGTEAGEQQLAAAREQAAEQMQADRQPARVGLDPGEPRSAPDVSPDDFEASIADGEIQVQLDEGTQQQLAEDELRGEVASDIPGLESSDVVLQETEEGYQLDRDATSERVFDSEDTEPGAVAEAVEFGAQQFRETPAGTGATILAQSLRTEEGLPAPSPTGDGTVTLPGQEDVDAATEALEPADQAFRDAVSTATIPARRASSALGDIDLGPGVPATGSFGLAAATDEDIREGAIEGVETGVQSLSPAAAAQDAIQLGDVQLRALERAGGEGGAEDVQTVFDVGGDVAGEAAEMAPGLAREAGAAAVRNPERAVQAGVAGGTVVLGGVAAGTGAAAGGRALGRLGSRGVSGVGDVADASVSTAQRAGRRAARSDRLPRVSVETDPDAGLVDIETPDLPSVRGRLGDVDAPDIGGMRTALGQRATGYAADLDLMYQRGRGRLDDSPLWSDTATGRVRPDRWEDAAGDAQQAVRRRMLGGAVDADLAIGRARSAVSDATPSRGDLPSIPEASDVRDWARLRATGAAVDADLMLQQARRRATLADRDTPLWDDTTTERAAPWAADIDGLRDAAGMRLTGAAVDMDLGMQRLRDAATFDRPSMPDVDVDSPLWSDTATGRPTPWAAETPDRPSVSGGLSDRLPSREDVVPFSDMDDISDVTFRVDLSGRSGSDADEVVDVEDLVAPGAAEGVPEYRQADVEGYAPGTDIPDTGGVGRNTLTQTNQIDVGGGQLARMETRMETPDVGTDSMQRLDELEDGIDDGLFGGVAGGAAGAGVAAGDRLGEAQTSSFDVDDDLGVGEESVGEVAGVEETTGLSEATGIRGAGLTTGLEWGTGTTTVTTQDFDTPTVQTPGTPTTTVPTPGTPPTPTPSPLPFPDADRDFDGGGFGVESDEALFGSGIMSGEEALSDIGGNGTSDGEDSLFGESDGSDYSLF